MNAMQDVSDEMREAVIDVTGERPEEIIADALLQGGGVMPQEVSKELFMEMVQVTEVEEGISGADVDESIKSMATNENILHVASFPLSKQIENVTGKPYRHLNHSQHL